MLALGVLLNDVGCEVGQILTNTNQKCLNVLSLIVVVARSDANILLCRDKSSLNVSESAIQGLGELKLVKIRADVQTEQH